MNIFKKKEKDFDEDYYDAYERKKNEAMKGNFIVGLVVAGIGGLAYLIQTYYPIFMEWFTTSLQK
jgi:hypothetical protein